MPVTVRVNLAGLHAAFDGLARFTGLDVAEVIRAEAGSILKACAGSTKVASQKTATIRGRLRLIRGLGYTRARNPGDITINAGLRGPAGRIWRRGENRRYKLAGVLSDSGTPRWEKRHFSRIQWLDIMDATAAVAAGLRRAIAASLQSIGLARQSWVQIADDLGIPLETVPGGRLSPAALAKARAALASSGRPYVNGTGREEYSVARGFFIRLTNQLPYGQRIGLDLVLARAINGRAAYFARNVRAGTFDRLDAIARAYPGLRLIRR